MEAVETRGEPVFFEIIIEFDIPTPIKSPDQSHHKVPAAASIHHLDLSDIVGNQCIWTLSTSWRHLRTVLEAAQNLWVDKVVTVYLAFPVAAPESLLTAKALRKMQFAAERLFQFAPFERQSFAVTMKHVL